MTSEEILLIVTKELTGQASEDEKNLLKDWLTESERNSVLYHSYKEAYLNGKYEPTARNKDHVYNQLAQRLQFEPTDKHTTIRKSRFRIGRLSASGLKVAAALLILISSSIVIYQSRELWEPESIVETVAHEIIIKSNPRGAKSQVTLPDGSKVKLNSESHLEYSSDFEHERSVKLVGEAFFEVVRDTLRPFYVNTGDLRLRVLGTSFNVEAFPFEKTINVALVTGKVLVEKKEGLRMQPMQYLAPEEMLSYDHQTADYRVSGFDAQQVIGWKDGVLHFDEADFDTVIEMLERWYGVEIIVNATNLSGLVTATYENQPLDVVLEGIGFTSDFNFEIKGKKVFIN